MSELGDCDSCGADGYSKESTVNEMFLCSKCFSSITNKNNFVLEGTQTMTKKTINTKQLTGNQIASIVQSIKLLNGLGIKELGIKESTKLTTFMVDCSNIYTDIIKSISDYLKSQNDKLIAENEDKKELITGLITIRHDINACNNFINEHKELEAIVPIMEQLNKDILELQDNLSNKLYTLNYNIDTLKLMRAIESTNPTVEQVTPISFLFI